MTQQLQNRFNIANTHYQRQKGQFDLLTRTHNQLEIDLQATTVRRQAEEDVLKLLQLVSASTWDATKQLVENLVTRALKDVFYDKDYKFVVKQEIKRGTSAVSFFVIEEGSERDLIDDLGGGISDVVSIVLRIALLTLYRPKTRQFLVLDEPLKHLWSGYQQHAAQFLKSVCHELGITMLVVTHQKELTLGADQIFQVRKVGDVCQVTEEPL